ncbi:hypothetical protein FFLO_00905 [Filobasidium floriforme]|uniref:Tc1-like transposase DDE domain-containing protein n=2 Tax=Filobasidium floriforme TaxID=5210 RepID=A0A8K0JSH9_9TREE|nr:hypothetical protein FFLO_00905 [Filobasidium floriforme]
MSIELSPRKRGKLVGLVTAGLSHRKAASRLGVSKSAVWRTLRRENLHNTQNSLPRSGRPPMLGEREKRRLIREVMAHPGEPWLYFANIFGVSISTVRKFANSMGLFKRHKRKKPLLTPKAIAARKSWMKENIGQDWRRVIFTDESSIELGLDVLQRWTIRKAGEAYLPQHLQTTFRSSRRTLMVWGAVAYGKKWDLVRLPLDSKDLEPEGVAAGKRQPKGLNGERYVRWIVNGPLKRCVQEHKRARWRDVLVLEDGAPCHSWSGTKAARAKHKIPSLTHPPSSPDLNPIENVWHLLKMKVSQEERRATNLDELWTQIQRCWKAIPIETINRLIDGMETRRAAVQQANGGSTRF